MHAGKKHYDRSYHYVDKPGKCSCISTMASVYQVGGCAVSSPMHRSWAILPATQAYFHHKLTMLEWFWS